MSYIISSVKNNNGSERYIGGKAKTLIGLKDLGFNVPDFFVISSDIQNITLIQNDIHRAYDDLGGLVAVRSSAVGEDGVVKSFAGQYKSVLNVSKERLIESIKECIKSLNTDHALAYSQNNAIGKMAVIIQKMVSADISGVAFSVDPVRNDESVMVIESVNGPCELLVSGTTTPDHYVVRKNNISESDIPDDIKRVAKISLEIENKLGYFADIEWAISNNDLHILQARPITTLKS
ncbi:MAG: PEP/pyruvate-binding domain-containing protein [Candidatus Paceibacterota bacterium]|jgi:pyruvate,water dikinase